MATSEATQTMQQPQAVTFTLNDVIKDAQRIHEFRGDKTFALTSFLREVDTLLPLVSDAPQAKNYIFNRIILNKIQGNALHVIRTLGPDPSWNDVKTALVNNFGVRESYHQLYQKAFASERRNVSDLFNYLCNILSKLNEKYEYDSEKPVEFNPKINEKIILKTFLNNINTNLALVIINKNVINLRDAYNLLISEGLIKVFENYHSQKFNKGKQEDSNNRHFVKPNLSSNTQQYTQNTTHKQNNHNNSGQYRNSNNHNNSGQYRNFNNHNNSGQYRNLNGSGQHRNFNNYNNSGQTRLSTRYAPQQTVEPMETDHIEEVNFHLDPSKTIYR